MKPWVIKKIEELTGKTTFLKTNGSGKLYLTDKGTYEAAGGGSTASDIIEYNAAANNQIFQFTPQAGALYLVNAASYSGVKVTLNSVVKGVTINIKNITASGTVTITTALDGATNFVLQPLNSVTIVYTGKQWVII